MDMTRRFCLAGGAALPLALPAEGTVPRLPAEQPAKRILLAEPLYGVRSILQFILVKRFTATVTEIESEPVARALLEHSANKFDCVYWGFERRPDKLRGPQLITAASWIVQGVDLHKPYSLRRFSAILEQKTGWREAMDDGR